MADAAIRAALDAAAGAVFDLRAANPDATVQQAAATAVAAFLRAPGMDGHLGGAHAVASAVEEAARAR